MMSAFSRDAVFSVFIGNEFLEGKKDINEESIFKGVDGKAFVYIGEFESGSAVHGYSDPKALEEWNDIVLSASRNSSESSDDAMYLRWREEKHFEFFVHPYNTPGRRNRLPLNKACMSIEQVSFKKFAVDLEDGSNQVIL